MINLVLGLFVGLMIGCASSVGQGLLRFQDREFLIHPDKPAMSFPYSKEVCVERTGIYKILGKKCHMEHVEVNYDLTIKAERDKFINASCTMKCAGRFQY